jgi:hypothetical protein
LALLKGVLFLDVLDILLLYNLDEDLFKGDLASLELDISLSMASFE